MLKNTIFLIAIIAVTFSIMIEFKPKFTGPVEIIQVEVPTIHSYVKHTEPVESLVIHNYVKHIEQYNVEDAKTISISLVKWAKEYNIDAILVLSIIESESMFKSNTKHNSVIGLGGIHKNFWKKTLAEYGLDELDSIDSQVRAVFLVVKNISSIYKTNDYLEILHYYKGRGYDKISGTSGKN